MTSVYSAYNRIEETNLQKIFEVAKSWMANKGQFYKSGNRNEYIYRITCILNRAGLSPDQIGYTISSNHAISESMYEEMVKTVKTACTTRSGEFRSKVIYGKDQKTSLLDYI